MLVVVMNDSWGWALPMVSGRIWTVGAIAMRRLKSGRFKTSRPKATPGALHRRSATARLRKRHSWKREEADRLMLRQWPLSNFYSTVGLYSGFLCHGQVHEQHTWHTKSAICLNLGSGYLNFWYTLIVYPRNFLGCWAESFGIFLSKESCFQGVKSGLWPGLKLEVHPNWLTEYFIQIEIE